MKKYILLLTCLLFTLPTFAIKFDGIEIKGKGEDFVRALKAKGYTFLSRDESKNVRSLSTWCVTRNMLGSTNFFYIETTPTTDNICEVSTYLLFSKKEFDDAYDKILEKMITEYGKPKYSYDYRTSKKKNKKYIPQDQFNHIMYHLWDVDDYTIILDCTRNERTQDSHIEIIFRVPGYNPLNPLSIFFLSQF